jgi:hypothetical protein
MKYLLLLLACIYVCEAAYTIQSNFSGSTFFSNWQFFTDNDPTHGYVNFLSQAQAQSEGLITASDSKIYIGSDSKNVASGRGRNSVRITSSRSWNSGLFILDLVHMPYGCGTWPAWWMVGPNWPNNGEIDIIEGVNMQSVVATTLHTSNGCTQSSSTNMFTGTWSLGTNGQPATNCYINAPNQNNNQGCGIEGNAGSYGDSFNNGQGGVYATEWTADHIQIFFFKRGSIPSDITADRPDPSGWGKPYAYFALGSACPANKFQNMNLVFDLTFCGDWAGAVFGSQCPGKGACNTYVQNNPSAFADAYWQINSVKVFQQ